MACPFFFFQFSHSYLLKNVEYVMFRSELKLLRVWFHQKNNRNNNFNQFEENVNSLTLSKGIWVGALKNKYRRQYFKGVISLCIP